MGTSDLQPIDQKPRWQACLATGLSNVAGRASWDRALNLWDATLPPGGQCQN